MDPVMALDWQREYLEWLGTDRAQQYFTAFSKDFRGEHNHTAREIDATAVKLRQMLKAMFLLAETYAVDGEMMELIEYAADSLPDDRVFPWTLPSPFGFALFPHVVKFESGAPNRLPMLLRAVSWYTVGERVQIAYFSDNEDLASEYGLPIVPGQWMSHLSLAHIESIKMDTHLRDLASRVVSKDGSLPSEQAVRETVRCLMMVVAFWHLCQQTIVETPVARVPRHAEKRWKRSADGQLHVTRIVRLRRSSASQRPEGEGMDWKHRWVVRGHWRQQPCGPNRAETRPVWIAAYIKGPEDKPLLSSDKIHYLVR